MVPLFAVQPDRFGVIGDREGVTRERLGIGCDGDEVAVETVVEERAGFVERGLGHGVVLLVEFELDLVPLLGVDHVRGEDVTRRTSDDDLVVPTAQVCSATNQERKAKEGGEGGKVKPSPCESVRQTGHYQSCC
jgi:hypothetical protein